MSKSLLLRLHRWVALTFALPLLAVIATGLILSFEPIVVQSAIEPGSVSVQTVEGLLQRYDPQGTARAIVLRPNENTLTVNGVQPGGSVTLDLRTGEPVARTTRSLSDMFGTARQIHEHLLLRAGWLVTASTMAMLALIALGIFMGWPRLRNTLPGWHKGVGWFLLPLVILSPLTGLLLAFGISLAPAPAPASASGPPLPLREAVRVLAVEHDLSSLSWIRPLGRNLVARVAEDGEMRTYALNREGAVPMARSWPRLIHEGNWGGSALAILNLVTSVALLGLLLSGSWIWLRRQLRRSSGRQRVAKTT
ncbi:PepSY-associated TM helix domain-containing protein [Microvirga mediterraneensis]|uniref:PepSY domain-containing protein n=1 Tax=Microvirga mediterraneensis TaxID=2754695 RepID=A0A838BLB7_9HYPH|nr:PepSY-associated TM helix domain-containing protein [Microvirga mediterraneensis]MBA1155879.1 PepSY domain-containing protein [Microvirga mediterraneensis]